MLEMTDQELADLGWKLVARRGMNGNAVSVNAYDEGPEAVNFAMEWLRQGCIVSRLPSPVSVRETVREDT